MAHEDVIGFIRNNHRAVLATHRRDGGIQQSPVAATVDAQDRVVISSRTGAIKTLNLQRDPRASLCVMNNGFYGEWHSVDGPVDILELP